MTDSDTLARQRAATTLAALRKGIDGTAAGIPDDGDLHVFGNWRDGIAALLGAAPQGVKAVERVYEMLCRDNAWLALVAATPPTAQRTTAGETLPPLVAAALTATEPAGLLIDRYLAHAQSVVPGAPLAFHEAAALTLVACAVAGRCHYASGRFKITPTMWSMIIAPPARYKKSQALDLMLDVANDSGLKALLMTHQRITPEALVDELRPTVLKTDMRAFEREVQVRERAWASMRTWVLDEAHGLFASAKREFNVDLMPALLRLADGRDISVRTKSRGSETVIDPRVSFFGATTPGAFQWFLSDRTFWRDGFLSRIDFAIPPDGPPAEWTMEPDQVETPSSISRTLRTIRDMFPEPTNEWVDDPKNKEGWVRHTGVASVAVAATDEARALWEAYRKLCEGTRLTEHVSEEISGSITRLSAKAMRVAMLLACADAADANDDGRSVTIELRHMARAVRYAERQRVTLLAVYAEYARTEENDLQRRILARLTKAASTGEAVTAYELCQSLRAKSKDVQEALLLLAQAGEVGQAKAKRGQREVEIWVRIDLEPQVAPPAAPALSA